MEHTATIDRYVSSYLQRQDYFRRSAELCHDQCREVLEQNGIRHIATYRAKRLERLREKLYQRATEGHRYEDDHDIEHDIVDLAGVRVALYFPGDAVNTAKVLTAQFEVQHTRTFPLDQERRGARIYKYRFPGYSATHLRARMRPDTLDPKERHYAHAQIEIQIASVFMHAWAEVEHDLVYKPLRGELSIGEYSLLDQVNGLAFSGEVALEQLQRVMRDRIAESERRFQSQFDLAAYIHRALSAPETPPMGRADQLLRFLAKLSLDKPMLLEPFLQSLRTSTEPRPFVDQIVDLIVASDPRTAKTRLDLWKGIGATTSESDLAPNDSASKANGDGAERRLRKRWSTFDSAARAVLGRLQPSPSALQPHAWMDREALEKNLGFDGNTSAAIIAAHQACVRLLADKWTGTDEQLRSHANTLEGAIRRLYVQFPGMIDDARSEG